MEEVDKKYDEIFLDEKTIKVVEKLPNKIVSSLEKGKIINKEWKNNKKNVLINECSNIENNIISINTIKEKIKNNNSLDHSLQFIYENCDINKLIEQIEKIGKIEDMNDKNLFDSKIEFEQKSVKIWIDNKNFKAELLYRKSRDGSKSEEFYHRCDN